MNFEWPTKLILSNEITQQGLAMIYRKQISLRGEVKDTREAPKMVLLHQDISCKNTEAAFLGALRISVEGEPSATQRLLAATMSLHVDGENVLMGEIGDFASTHELQPIKPQPPKVSCLFKAKAFQGEDASHLEAAMVGLFLPNGSLISVFVDELRGRAILDASITIELELGLYDMLGK